MVVKRRHQPCRRGSLIVAFLAALTLSLTGCVWSRLYETKTQLAHFDDHFRVEVQDRFILSFKDPVLYSSDFAYLTKLKASRIQRAQNGKTWYYDFFKIDDDGRGIDPAISFAFELKFNAEDRLSVWAFSPVFLAMMPPEFLEISLRSLGTAEIVKSKKQLRADPNAILKADAIPPTREKIERRFGLPLKIRKKPNALLYIYHFRLITSEIEEGYEDRALTKLKLYFNPESDHLVRMSGRFAGLKLSIDYRKLLRKTEISL
ncbi:MAG: hypothetical protein ABFS02_12250 [Pseudomonadota bacterium]